AEAADMLVFSLQYNCDLFDPTTIRRMLEHLQVLLEHSVARPEQRISALPLLAPAERQQILLTWNATPAEYPDQACIHELIEAQVARRPDAVAVVFDDHRPPTTDHRPPTTDRLTTAGEGQRTKDERRRTKDEGRRPEGTRKDEQDSFRV